MCFGSESWRFRLSLGLVCHLLGGTLFLADSVFFFAESSLWVLTAIAALLAGRQPHNAPLLHSARTVHEVVAEENRSALLLENTATRPALPAGDSLASRARPL